VEKRYGKKLIKVCMNKYQVCRNVRTLVHFIIRSGHQQTCQVASESIASGGGRSDR
jgi:hypothetical protein